MFSAELLSYMNRAPGKCDFWFRSCVIHLAVLDSQLMLHLSWDLASCGWHVWIPGLLLSELWGLVAERQHAVCRANIVLWSSVSYLPFSGSLQLILLFQETVFYIGPVAAGSLCLNGWICPCCALFRIQWGADPAVLIAPGGKMVFISCERQWFVAERVLFEISQLSKGISKLLLQSLLVSDENGIFSLSKVLFLLLKSTNWSTLWFDIQILVIFSKEKI